MSQRLLFKDDPERALKIWWETTDYGFQLHYEQDVEKILDLNKAKQRAGRDYYAQDKEMWRVASIPITIQMEWMTKHGVDIHNDDHWPRVQRLLNDPDYRYLKTADIII
jgi:hypothetical protein